MRWKGAATGLCLLCLSLVTASCLSSCAGLLLSSDRYGPRDFTAHAEIDVLKDLPRPLQGEISLVIEPDADLMVPGGELDSLFEMINDFSKTLTERLRSRGMLVSLPSMWTIQIRITRFDPGSVWRIRTGYLNSRWSVIDQFGVVIGEGTINVDVGPAIRPITLHFMMRTAADRFANYLAGEPKKDDDTAFE